MNHEEFCVLVEELSDLHDIADTIDRYLVSCPEASETVEGVARWWLARQRYNDSLELVQCALDVLESQGRVERIKAGKGAVLYRKSDLLDRTYSVNTQ